jgi:hypothetical protein
VSQPGSLGFSRRDIGFGLFGFGLAALLKPSVSLAAGPVIGELKSLAADAREEAAYLLGMESYVYGLPLVLMDLTNGVLTATEKPGEYKAPINQLIRVRGFINPDFKDVVRISVSSVWSFAVFDLENGPIVVSYPEINGRYFVIQLMNNWTDDFGSVGTRTNATGGGNFLIAGPKWDGTLPADIKDVYRCSTRYGWIPVQMSANSPADFPEIHRLQDKLKITPVAAWGSAYTPPDNVPVNPDVDLTATPYDQLRLMTGVSFFRRLALLLKDNPPYPADGPALEKLSKLGIEPGKDFDTASLDPAIAKGLNRVPGEVWLKFQQGPYAAPTVNGWQNMLNLGRYGTDYVTRALVAWFGLGALTSDDAAYPTAFIDGDGSILDGAGKYVLHFEKGEMPPSEVGVWSVSAYRENFYVRNSIDRYGVLSGMPLKYNGDGSLDIYIQAKSPGPDKEANWLPCPPSDPINVTMRVYQPKKSLLDGSYKIPPIKKAA